MAEELNDQKEKYAALEQTWLAANQQFIAFQEMARADLELAKSLMTADQKRHFGELRARGGADVADYSDEVRYMPFLIEGSLICPGAFLQQFLSNHENHINAAKMPSKTPKASYKNGFIKV